MLPCRRHRIGIHLLMAGPGAAPSACAPLSRFQRERLGHVLVRPHRQSALIRSRIGDRALSFHPCSFVHRSSPLQRGANNGSGFRTHSVAHARLEITPGQKTRAPTVIPSANRGTCSVSGARSAGPDLTRRDERSAIGPRAHLLPFRSRG